VDKDKFVLMPPSNYFHKLVEKEWVETEREKHRKVKFDKRRPQSAGGGLGLGYGEGRNSMGFEGKSKGPPIKDNGKSPLGADSRDKSVRTRGFGELPTRKDSPAQRERAGRARNVMGRDLGTAREYVFCLWWCLFISVHLGLLLPAHLHSLTPHDMSLTSSYPPLNQSIVNQHTTPSHYFLPKTGTLRGTAQAVPPRRRRGRQ
jgi:hypothetical protein